MIRMGGIISESVVDGPGFRVVVFFQGCPRRCVGCQNPALLPAEGGTEVGAEELADMIAAKMTSLHKGVTFSGGDPLMQPEELLAAVAALRALRPGIDVWVYTGYVYEEVAALPVMELIDVLVDGPFVPDRKDLSLPFRGSRNQRLVDVPATRRAGQVVEKLL